MSLYQTKMDSMLIEMQYNAIPILVAAGAKLEDAFIKFLTRGETEPVQLLIEGGVDIEVRNTRGETAVMLAAWYDSQSLESILKRVSRETINVRDSEGNTILMWALKKNYMKTFKLLLDAGANDRGILEQAKMLDNHIAIDMLTRLA